MQQSNPILLNQLKQDYIALQQLGSPLLACQGMFVPRGMEDLRFLFKSCPRPIVSNEDPAEVQYAGGFTGIVAGPPKTHYTGNLQILVTEAGHDQLLAEYVEPEPVSVKDAIQYAQQVLGDDFISVQMYDSLFSNACNYLKLIDYVSKDPLFVIKSLIINIKKYKF